MPIHDRHFQPSTSTVQLTANLTSSGALPVPTVAFNALVDLLVEAFLIERTAANTNSAPRTEA